MGIYELLSMTGGPKNTKSFALLVFNKPRSGTPKPQGPAPETSPGGLIPDHPAGILAIPEVCLDDGDWTGAQTDCYGEKQGQIGDIGALRTVIVLSAKSDWYGDLPSFA